MRLRWLRLLLVLAALGAVAPDSARAAYAEVATASSAPVVAAAVVVADRASAPDVVVHARPLRARSVALPVAQAPPVHRRYLLLQSLLL